MKQILTLAAILLCTSCEKTKNFECVCKDKHATVVKTIPMSSKTFSESESKCDIESQWYKLDGGYCWLY